jgi:hypothetical protein
MAEKIIWAKMASGAKIKTAGEESTNPTGLVAHHP